MRFEDYPRGKHGFTGSGTTELQGRFVRFSNVLDGRFSGGKHVFMVRRNLVLTIPNPHRGDIGPALLASFCDELASAGKSASGSDVRWPQVRMPAGSARAVPHDGVLPCAVRNFTKPGITRDNITMMATSEFSTRTDIATVTNVPPIHIDNMCRDEASQRS